MPSRWGIWDKAPAFLLTDSFPPSGQGCDRQMIFDMLKRLRSVVYLPNDYVCKKVSCMGLQGLGGCLLAQQRSHAAEEPWALLPSVSKAPFTQRSPPCRKEVVGL